MFATNGFRHVNMSEGEKTQTNVYKSKEWLDKFFLKNINNINNDTKDTTINQKSTLRDACQAAWFYFVEAAKIKACPSRVF